MLLQERFKKISNLNEEGGLDLCTSILIILPSFSMTIPCDK